MPVALALIAIDAVLVVHAARRGRLCPWGLVILGVPGIGALAYVACELIPAWRKHLECRKVQRCIRRALAPERRYRALAAEIATADTIARRAALAGECVALGLFEDAKHHYDEILARPYGAAPAILLGRAQAEHGLGRFADAVATLDALKARWPDYESSDGHLLYACALEESGRANEALAEYEALARYSAAAEPRVRRALLLKKLGRTRDADASLVGVLREFAQAPRFVRRAEAEWIALAERSLRG